MVSCQFLSFFVLTCLLLLFVSPTHSSSDNIIVASGPVLPPVTSQQILLSTQKVTMSLYYESLCPYCQNFIVQHLAPVFKTDLMTILNLKLVPWGNAIRQPPNNSIICQHGEEECYLNTIHACSINIWPVVKTHFDFINCIEQQSSDFPLQHGAKATWKACADQLGLPKKPIKDCYDSGYGRKLTLQYGKETEHLNPPHTYVPWVVVNNKPLYNDYANFKKHVCKAYKGKPAPKSCGSLPTNSIEKKLPTNSIEKKKPRQAVCHADEARAATDSWMHQTKMEPPA